MTRSPRARFLRLVLCTFLLCIIFAPAARAECSDGEMTAVFVVGGIYPATDLTIERLAVNPVGDETYPPESEIIAALAAAMPDTPPLWMHIGTVGHIGVFFVDPIDSGACALVDMRDGAIVFGGTVVWMGHGAVVIPSVSTHPWFEGMSDPAPAPATVDLVPSGWPDEWGTHEAITDQVLDVLRHTDVLHSFGECGEYAVLSCIYTPTVGTVDPLVAKLIVVVNGSCGPPWNGDPVAAQRRSWSAVRALFD